MKPSLINLVLGSYLVCLANSRKGSLIRHEGGCNEQTHRLASLAKVSDITLSYLMLEIGLLILAITKTHGIVIIYTGRCGKPVT